MLKPIASFALLIALVSCSDSEDTTTQQQAGPAEPPSTPAQRQTTSTAPLAANEGRVVSHISVPGYTYIEVDRSGQRTWLAGSPIEVEDGEVIGWEQATMMTNFPSKALNRTFDRILFAGRIYKASARTGSATATRPPVRTGGTMSRGSRGRVLSVKNSANYSYLEVELDSGNTIWIAAPEIRVGVNDAVTWQGGSVMRDFPSKSLQRTFEEILFVGQVTVQR
jgi:hypothetical protein|tara:strand:- start:6411 stop:7079 length:669 start_codon:yes stop_codon:yes gene_type:complete